METLTYTPSRSTQGRAKQNVLVAKFRRYEQRAKDGPDSAKFRDWTLVYTPTTQAIMKEMYEFFVARGGAEKFLWTEPPPFDTDPDQPRAFFNEAPEWIYEGGEVMGFSVSLIGVPAL